MQTTGLQALRHPPLAFYLSAKLLHMLAQQIINVAMGWQVYNLSGDLLDLGLIGLCQFAPFVILVLPAGQLADHWDRRRIMLACFSLQVIAAGLLLVFVLLAWRNLNFIFAVAALMGVTRAFAMPAGQALLLNLIPRHLYASAMALSSSSFHVAVVLGPVVGGLLYLAGPQAAYGGSLVLSLAAVLCVAAVRSLQAQAPAAPVSWQSLFEGLRFVWSRPMVLGAISLDLFAVLFGGATALLPAFAKDVLQVGPVGLGWLRTAPALGAVVVSALLTFYPITRQVGRWMFGGVALFGICTIAFGASQTPWLAFTALVVMGGGDMLSVYIRHILVQLATPDAIRGRVSAVNSVFIGASNELGEFESGLSARFMGLVPAILFGGLATLGVVGICARGFRVLWRMDRFPEADDTQ